MEGFGSIKIMDLDEGGPKSNQNTYKFSHLHHIHKCLKGTVAWLGFLTHSVPSCLHRTYLEVFLIFHQGSRVVDEIYRVVRASDSQCQSRNCPGFDPSIFRHSGLWVAADEAVLKYWKNSFMYDSHLLCVLDTSYYFQRARLDLLTTPPPLFSSSIYRLVGWPIVFGEEIWAQGTVRPRPPNRLTDIWVMGRVSMWGGAGGWGLGLGRRCQSTKIHQCHPVLQRRNFFQSQEMIADSPLLGQSVSGLNFYDDSGTQSASGLKAFIPSFSPPLAD